MNAGRDVERQISEWLAVEAATGAPDRVVHETRRLVNSTGQRRFLAAWREPMYLSPIKLAAVAAALAVAVGGGFLLGRSSSSLGPAAPATTMPATPAPSAATSLESFRSARNEICVRYASLADPYKDAYLGAFDPGVSPTELASKVEALRQLRIQVNRMLGELQELPVPAEIAAEQAVALANQDSVNRLIAQTIDRFVANDLAGAEALDLATNPNARQIENFEKRYSLTNCP